jgi:hypothetical protein
MTREKHGILYTVRDLMTNRETGQPEGFAFVEMTGGIVRTRDTGKHGQS